MKTHSVKHIITSLLLVCYCQRAGDRKDKINPNFDPSPVFLTTAGKKCKKWIDKI
jgi:hypothetical protein